MKKSNSSYQLVSAIVEIIELYIKNTKNMKNKNIVFEEPLFYFKIHTQSGKYEKYI